MWGDLDMYQSQGGLFLYAIEYYPYLGVGNLNFEMFSVFFRAGSFALFRHSSFDRKYFLLLGFEPGGLQ